MADAAAVGVRRIELLGVLSLATDLGTGQPAFHGVRTAVLAVALGRQLGLDDSAVADLQRVALLRFLGCTADSAETALLAGGDDIAFLAAMAPVAMGSRAEAGRALLGAVGADRPPLHRAALLVAAVSDPGGARRSLSAHCEVAAMLAERLGVGDRVTGALAHAHERWDGAGFPDGLAGEEVPLPVRVAVVARDADLAWRAGPSEPARVLSGRRGRAYDPRVVDACLAAGPEVLARLDGADPWEELLATAPADDRIQPADLDRALTAVADFADLKSSATRGHSPRVAELSTAAAAALGMPPGDVAELRRAALVHDLGRVGVPAGIWDRPGPLGVAERERVRLHAYLTESTLTCCPGLARLGRLAGAHHERRDGSGYHRGTRDGSRPQQVLAVADVVAAMAAARPHRPQVDPAGVADAVRAEVRSGRLDGAAAEAVLVAAGQARVRPAAARPAGLSDREVQVLQLVARGATDREVAARLQLSVKTVGRHVENLYAKAGVRSRAAAALFAMEHRLLDG